MARCSSCWQPRTPRLVYGGVEPTLNQLGMIELAAYPDCETPHTGERQNDTFYVVGVGTPHETVLPREKSKYAVAFARSFNPPLRVTKAQGNQLCDRAVLDAVAQGA